MSSKIQLLRLSCLFKDTTAPKRNEWFDILHELSTETFPEKVIVKGMDEYQWEAVDKWTLKLVCGSISDCEK